MKNKIIWSNMNLNVDDWRDGYAEYCETNEIESGNEYDVYNWMEETNALYCGEYISPQKLNYYTRSIYPDVARVYGWREKTI